MAPELGYTRDGISIAAPAMRGGVEVLVDEWTKLIERARAGSKDAFCQIVRFYQGQVRPYLARYVRDKEVVDDLAQETFLSAYLSLATFEDGRPVGAWLMGIARNRALRYLRSEKQRRAREQNALQAALSGWWADLIESEVSGTREGEISALQSCIEKLPQHSGSMVREYYFKGKTAGDLAREGGKTEVSVWVTMQRIRQALRECVEHRLKGPQA